MAIPAHHPAFISVEAYLQGDYGEYESDVDYVDGCIEERNLGTKDHSKWQQAIMLWFARHENEWSTLSLPELRIRTGPRRFRVADVAILDSDAPDEQVPSHPPLAVFEGLSRYYRRRRVRVRLADYAAMGVPEIWLIDPATGGFERFEDGKLVLREQFSLAARSINFAVTEIAKLVKRR